jgi:hypothetical protein
MKPPANGNGGPRKEAAARMKKPDEIAALSNWLKSQWLRSYALYSALGGERDRERMAMLARFIDALKEVQP